MWGGRLNISLVRLATVDTYDIGWQAIYFPVEVDRKGYIGHGVAG